ncbi:MAG: histidine kinase [Lachnospiraceae bacterium]|nr:histidine kinase [Lachnospiraceae bacterium]
MGQKNMQGKRIKEKVQNSIKRNALSRKLSGVIIIVALILIIVSLVFVFFIITMERKQYAERESENVLSSLSTSIGSDIDKYNNISRLIMIEPQVKNYLKADKRIIDLFAYSEGARLGTLNILNVTTSVDSVFIFRNDLEYSTTINPLEYRLDWDRIHERDWKSGLLANKGSSSLSLNGNGAIIKTKPATLLTINRAIYDNVSQKQTGFLFMNLSTDFMEDEINQLSSENICICTSDGIYLAGNIKLLNYYDKAYTYDEITEIKVSNPKDAMTISGLKVRGFPLVILYSITNERRLLPMELLYFIIILPIIYLVCVMVAGSFIKKNITNPIFDLTSEMEKKRQKEVIEKIDINLPDNEIGALQESYNNMVDHSNLLMDRLVEKEQTLQKAEMRVLQEQIKPHFLYNSLETIGFLAIDAGADKVHGALETLGSFYRNFLSKGDREIPLKREITIIKDYLSLQKLRYGDIINDEYDIAKDTEDCIIPKLILQPLAENSIYHGIRMKGEKGTIKISSFRTKDELHIVVRDTGIGMSQEQIDKVLSKEKSEISEEFSGSFGLWGTIERIRSYCDKDDVVRIRSEMGEYTEIEIIISLLPKQWKTAGESRRTTDQEEKVVGNTEENSNVQSNAD